ncbi:MAG TPA: response regulator [Thermoanaerobaculia bacterium]
MATATFTALPEAPAESVIFRQGICCALLCSVVQTGEDVAKEPPYCVLVVDDDPSIRRMIVAALKRDGYVFHEAPNGKEALDLMRREHPNVVVLDLMMPVLSGWDVLQARELEPDLKKIPVIIISANRAPEVATAVDKGICAFLPKPFDIGALSALVRSCLPLNSPARTTVPPQADEAEAPVC